MKRTSSKYIFVLASALLLAGCTTQSIVSSSASKEEIPSSELPSSLETSSSQTEIPSSTWVPISSSQATPSSSQTLPSSAPTPSSSQAPAPSSSSAPASSSAPLKEYFTISTVDSDHLTIQLADQYGQAKTSFAQGDKVVVKINGITPNGYAVKKLEYGTKGADSLDHWAYTEITDIDASGNYYFTMPYVATGGSICVRVSEKNLSVLNGYNLVGTYLGIDISNASGRDFTSFNDGSNVTIEASGEYTYKAVEGLLVESATASSGEGSAILNNGKYFYYSDKLIYGSTYPGSDGAFDSFDYIGVKMENGTDSASSYSVKAESFKLGERDYIAVQAYKNNAFYAGGFIDKNSRKAYLDVTFDFIYGETVTDTRCMYDVKKGDTVLATVSTKLDGGASNRIVPTAPYGVYHAANEKDLFLFGDGKTAIYDSTEFNAVLDEDGVTLTLTAGLRTVIGTIDANASTFTVTSDEETQIGETPKFAGSTYVGTFNAGEDAMQWELTFSEDGATVSSRAGYSLGYTPYLKKENMAVTYDAGAGTVKFALQNFSDTPVEMTLNYNYSGDSFTCMTNYSSFYATKNATLTKN